jgi:predicted ester cyclase
MGETNGKGIVKNVLDAFNDRAWDQIPSLYTDGYVNHNAPPGLSGDRDGQLQAMQGLCEAFPDARVEATHVIAEDDLVMVRDILRGTHEGQFGDAAPTGKGVELQFIHLYKISGGQISERWGLVDASDVG